ncbi:MAG: DUF2065 domain-containing protein [Gammaproteobacteria bacterium]
MAWNDFGAALALWLVLEGVLPFLNPRGFRESLHAIQQFSDRGLRMLGLVSMVGGLMLLYAVRG